MSTRCKFKCVSITRSMSSKYVEKNGISVWTPTPLDTAKLVVVTGDSAENKSFFASTPSGAFEVGLHDPDAFVVGEEYYIDVTLAAPVPVKPSTPFENPDAE